MRRIKHSLVALGTMLVLALASAALPLAAWAANGGGGGP